MPPANDGVGINGIKPCCYPSVYLLNAPTAKNGAF